MTKNDQTVDAVLKYLEEKYDTTEWEKFAELSSAMSFTLDKSVSGELILSKVDKIMTEVETLKLKTK